MKTFHRIGALPGRKSKLDGLSWQAKAIPVSEGMSPVGRNWYTDQSGRVTSGIWSCNAGNVEIRDNPVEEISFVIRGTVNITDSLGHSEAFGPGECLVLPRGFSGMWSHSDDFEKFYVRISDA